MISSRTPLADTRGDIARRIRYTQGMVWLVALVGAIAVFSPDLIIEIPHLARA